MKQQIKIAVCALANLDTNPRPNRMVNFLKGISIVTYIGFGSSQEGVSFVRIKKNNTVYIKILRTLFRLLRLHSSLEKLNYKIPFDFNSQDLVICHDLELLPYILAEKKSFKILFDAREYYPKHFENKLIWRILQLPFQIHLCKKYLSRIDYGITVSDGLKKAYEEFFFVNMDVFYSLPFYNELPVKNMEGRIRMVHHGSAVEGREIERMIYAMDSVKENVTLDLILVGSGKYLKKLSVLTKNRSNVRILKPVPFEKIIPTLNAYDIGLVFFPPSTFNLEHCMPNKLFEYIQARLAIITAPLADLMIFVQKYQVGLVCQSYECDDLAKTINKLNEDDILNYKANSDNIAKRFSQESNNDKLLGIINKLISNKI